MLHANKCSILSNSKKSITLRTSINRIFTVFLLYPKMSTWSFPGYMITQFLNLPYTHFYERTLWNIKVPWYFLFSQFFCCNLLNYPITCWRLKQFLFDSASYKACLFPEGLYSILCFMEFSKCIFVEAYIIFQSGKKCKVFHIHTYIW